MLPPLSVPKLSAPSPATLQAYRNVCHRYYGLAFDSEEEAKESFLRLAHLYLLLLLPNRNSIANRATTKSAIR